MNIQTLVDEEDLEEAKKPEPLKIEPLPPLPLLPQDPRRESLDSETEDVVERLVQAGMFDLLLFTESSSSDLQ